jgi:hypothetical protein
MKRIFFCITIILGAFTVSAAQDTIRSEMELKEDTLAVLSYTMVNDSTPDLRFATCAKIIPLLVSALRAENSFDHPFTRLPFISIQYPADSSFRIFSWELFVSEDERRYYGAIQMNTPELQLFPLIDRSFEIQDPQEQTSNKNWYGALYYKLIDFQDEQGSGYLLMGYDHLSRYEKSKLIEVLRFVDGKPVFGHPVFLGEDGDSLRQLHRIIRTYDAYSSVGLNFDPHLGMIVTDHLEVMGTERGPIWVPNGSYIGYKWEDGKWRYMNKLFDIILEEAPRPEPVLNKDAGKNILGEKKSEKSAEKFEKD